MNVSEALRHLCYVVVVSIFGVNGNSCIETVRVQAQKVSEEEREGQDMCGAADMSRINLLRRSTKLLLISVSTLQVASSQRTSERLRRV